MSTRRSTLLQLGIGLGMGLGTSVLPGVAGSAAAQAADAATGSTGALGSAGNLPHQLPLLSTAPLGSAIARGWEHQRLPNGKPANQFMIAPDPALASGASAGPGHVLQMRSSASSSSWIARTDINASTLPWLHWRWRVSHALAGSDLSQKDGDDYAARLYVFFDLPLDRLSFGDNLKIRAARALSGADVPAAALCYVWGGTRQATGTSAWNPYTDRVRMIVMDSPPQSPPETWRSHARDIRRDWTEAFGGAMPHVSGVGIGGDTDNTGESVDAWFGDLQFSNSSGEPAPDRGA